jgi:hypothetical protein
MALVDIIGDFHAQLCAIDADFAAAEPDPLLGRVYLQETAAPPRVVWVPLRAAPDPHVPHGRDPRPIGLPRALAVECHIWGRDTAAAETLLFEVHNAARRSLGAGARWVSEDWPDFDGDTSVKFGAKVVVVFQFRIPITEVGQETVTVTAVEQTTEIDFADGEVVSGEPAP